VACILIVEDSPAQAEQISLILEKGGHETCVVHTGSEAMALLSLESKVSAVVIGAVMPEMSGYELCQKLRSSSHFPDLPVLLLTAAADHLDLIQSFQAGADAFLTKPYDPDSLLARLGSILADRVPRDNGVAIDSNITLRGQEVRLNTNLEYLVNILVTSIEDLTESNIKLQRSMAEMETAKRVLTVRANMLSSRLAATETSLNMRKDTIEAIESVILVLEKRGGQLFIVDVNKASVGLSGYHPAHLSGQLFDILLAVEERAALIDEILQSVEEYGSYHRPIRIISQNGSPRYCSANVIKKSEINAESNRYICVLTDVSSNYSISAAMEVLTSELVGLQGREYFDTAALKLNEILGVSVVVISQVLYDGEGSKQHLPRSTVKEGEVLQNMRFEPGNALYHRLFESGSLLISSNVKNAFPDTLVFREWNVEAFLAEEIIDPTGKILGHISIMDTKPFENISALKEILRIFNLAIGNVLANELSQKRYFDLFQFAPDAMLMINEDAEILIANASASTLFGYAENEMVNKKVNALFPDVRDYIKKVKRRFFAESRKSPIKEDGVELEGMTRDGKRIPIELSASSISTSAGPRLLIACRDLTDRNQQEADRLARIEAEKASQEKSAFLATMSHEIRTPINGVIGSADLLARESLEDQQAELVETIRDSSRNLLQVIDDILDFSKIEAGKLTLTMETMSIKKVAELVCRSLRSYATDNGVRLKLFTDPRLPRLIVSDSVRITQIINNLLSNAVKFSKRETGAGNVYIRVEKAGEGKLRVLVKDDGIGIKKEVQSKLFKPFSQAEATTSRKFGGTGLGLSICKRLVEMLNGDIGFESEPGVGTTFFFTMPYEEAGAGDVGRPVEALSGIHCLVMTQDNQMYDDWCAYLGFAGATHERIDSLSKRLEMVEQLPDSTVFIVEDYDRSIMESYRERNVSPALPVVFIESGRRRQGRLIMKNIVCLDIEAMTQNDLVLAVAMALGREQEVRSRREEKLGGASLPPPDREEAIAKRELILVAEDNEVNQKVVRRQLAAIGYVSDVVPNGRQALYAWRKGIYSLVITDIHMPEMDGYELTSAIREEEAGNHRVPIIALTANALKGEEDVCRKSGMDDYLSKPVPLEKLQQTIRKWLDSNSREETSELQVISSIRSSDKILDLNVLREMVGDEEDMIRDFVREYRKAMEKGRDELLVAVRSKDLKAAAGVAHRMKSSAKTMGSFKFAEFCQAIEDDVRNRVPLDQKMLIAQTELLLEELISSLDAV
jgi:PAS domain S-box-containing protein